MCDDANIYIVRTRLVQPTAYFCENPKHPKGHLFLHKLQYDITNNAIYIKHTHTNNNNEKQQAQCRTNLTSNP